MCKRQKYRNFREVAMHYHTQETTLIHPTTTQYFCDIKFNSKTSI